MAKELLDGEYKIPGLGAMTGREWASDILTEVAHAAEYGSYPCDISAFDVGRALGRALVNCDEEDAYKQMIRGFMHQRRRWERG